MYHFISTPQVLTKCVDAQELKPRYLLRDLLQFLRKQVDLRLVQQPDYLNLTQYSLNAELVPVFFSQQWIFFNLTQHRRPKVLSHLVDSLSVEISMTINKEWLARFKCNAPERLWDLNIQSKLETDLSFATARQSTNLDNFPDAKHHVQEILVVILIWLQV